MNTGSNYTTSTLKALTIAVMPFFLFACASNGAPRPEEARTAYFSEKPTKQETESKINRYLEQTLFDPYTAKVSCSQPTEKAWISYNMFQKPLYGYLVKCDINAKNRMGGYTGLTEYWFVFNGSEFQHVDPVRGMGLIK